MISRCWLFRHKNKKVLFRCALNFGVFAFLLSLYKPQSRLVVAHRTNKRNIGSVELYGSEANALWVVPFAFIFAHEILLIVILLGADAVAVCLCSVKQDHLLLSTWVWVWNSVLCHSLTRWSWFLASATGCSYVGIICGIVWSLEFVGRRCRARKSAVFLVFAVLFLGQNDVNLSSFYSLVSQPVNPLYFVHLWRLRVHSVRRSSRCWLNLRNIFPEEVLISLLRLNLLPLRNGSLHLRKEISLTLSFQERC